MKITLQEAKDIVAAAETAFVFPKFTEVCVPVLDLNGFMCEITVVRDDCI